MDCQCQSMQLPFLRGLPLNKFNSQIIPRDVTNIMSAKEHSGRIPSYPLITVTNLLYIVFATILCFCLSQHSNQVVVTGHV